jgi:cob(I)alamin adenosyltransferase
MAAKEKLQVDERRKKMKLNKGLIHIYFGDGKGKTSAAIGLAMRAAGNGLKVLVVQFFKPETTFSGERAYAREARRKIIFHNLKFRHPFMARGRSSAFLKKQIKGEVEKALALVKMEWKNGIWDVVVLDEINNALAGGFISWPRFAAFLRSRPAKVELICTGRGAPRNLLVLADYATEMKKIRHPFDRKIPARKGIEF